MNNEDWWDLVFDTDTKRLYVEHRWEHVDVRGSGAADNGVTEMDITTYLTEGGQGPGHRELFRLLTGLFEETPNAART